MTRTKLLLVTAALALSSAAFADEAGVNEATVEGVQHERYHEPQHIGNKAKHAKGSRAFTKADKDNDGTLTKDEAKAAPHISKHFDEIDADKDGTVDRDEVHAYMKAHHQK